MRPIVSTVLSLWEVLGGAHHIQYSVVGNAFVTIRIGHQSVCSGGNRAFPSTGLLHIPPEEAPEFLTCTMQTWILLLQLMEDEDGGVRRAAARTAGAAMAVHGREDQSFAAVPKVQRSCFAFLAAIFGSSPSFITQLLLWICRWLTRFEERFVLL